MWPVRTSRRPPSVSGSPIQILPNHKPRTCPSLSSKLTIRDREFLPRNARQCFGTLSRAALEYTARMEELTSASPSCAHWFWPDQRWPRNALQVQSRVSEPVKRPPVRSSRNSLGNFASILWRREPALGERCSTRRTRGTQPPSSVGDGWRAGKEIRFGCKRREQHRCARPRSGTTSSRAWSEFSRTERALAPSLLSTSRPGTAPRGKSVLCLAMLDTALFPEGDASIAARFRMEVDQLLRRLQGSGKCVHVCWMFSADTSNLVWQMLHCRSDLIVHKPVHGSRLAALAEELQARHFEHWQAEAGRSSAARWSTSEQPRRSKSRNGSTQEQARPSHDHEVAARRSQDHEVAARRSKDRVVGDGGDLLRLATVGSLAGMRILVVEDTMLEREGSLVQVADNGDQVVRLVAASMSNPVLDPEQQERVYEEIAEGFSQDLENSSLELLARVPEFSTSWSGCSGVQAPTMAFSRENAASRVLEFLAMDLLLVLNSLLTLFSFFFFKYQNTEQQVKGVLNLIDLAGSEWFSKSGSTRDRLKETQAINKSLSSLGAVILAFGDPFAPDFGD